MNASKTALLILLAFAVPLSLTGVTGIPVRAINQTNSTSTQGYALTVTSSPSVHGNPNYLGVTYWQAFQQVQLTVISPSDVTADSRWILDGYKLDNGIVTQGTSVSVTMSTAHTVQWNWHKEVQVVLSTNIPGWSQYVTLSGGGWQAAGTVVQIIAPAAITLGQSNWLFQRWAIVAGTGVIQDALKPSTSMTLQSDPTVEAQYQQTFEPITTAANNQEQVYFQVTDRNANPLAVYGAEVTVLGTDGSIIWSGLTDPQGYAPSKTSDPISLTVGTQYIIRISKNGAIVYSQQFLPQQIGVQTVTVDISGQAGFTPVSLDAPLVVPGLLVVGGISVTLVAMAVRQRNEQDRKRRQNRWLVR